MNRIIVLIIAFIVAGLCRVEAKSPKDSTIVESDYGMIRTNINSQIEHSKGAVSDHFNARISYQFVKSRSFTLTANAQYNTFDVDVENDRLSDGFTAEEIGINDLHITGNAGLTAQYNTFLLGKPFVGIGTVTTHFGEGGFQKVTGLLTGLFMLRQTRDTQFGIGPVVLINSSSKVPVFPAIMYQHRFSDLLAAYVHGGIIGLDFTPNNNNLFAIGADIDSKQVYFKTKDERLPRKSLLAISTFRPMLKYRLRLQRNLYIEAKAGVTILMKGKVTGANSTHEYIELSQKAQPFVLASVSYSL